MFLQKIRAYGDPRLFALTLVADQFAHSAQPIVPERLFTMGGGAEGGGPGVANVFNQLIAVLLAERTGMSPTDAPKGLEDLEKFAAELARRFARPDDQGQGATPDSIDESAEREIDAT